MSENFQDSRFSFRQLLLFIPFMLTIHNVEEALTMPQWVGMNFPILSDKIFLFRFISFSTEQIFISLFLVTIIPFIVTALCFRLPFEKRKVSVLLVLQGIIFWNALAPHLSGIILLGMYNPGTVTAMVINIPFSIYLFNRSFGEGMFTVENLRNIMLIALMVYLPVVYLIHLLAEFTAGIL